MSDASKPREWWIQKPIAHNCPLENHGAVFETFEPTIRQNNCEWVHVIECSAYDALKAENEALKAERDELQNHIGQHGCNIVNLTKENEALKENVDYLYEKYNQQCRGVDKILAKYQEEIKILREGLEYYKEHKYLKLNHQPNPQIGYTTFNFDIAGSFGHPYLVSAENGFTARATLAAADKVRDGK